MAPDVVVVQMVAAILATVFCVILLAACVVALARRPRRDRRGPVASEPGHRWLSVPRPTPSTLVPKRSAAAAE